MQDGIIIGLVMAVVFVGILFISNFFERYYEIKKKRRKLYKKK